MFISLDSLKTKRQEAKHRNRHTDETASGSRIAGERDTTPPADPRKPPKKTVTHEQRKIRRQAIARSMANLPENDRSYEAIANLAKQYAVSTAMIRKACREFGCKMSQTASLFSNEYNRHRPRGGNSQRDAIHVVVSAMAGKGQSEIARELNITRQAVNQILVIADRLDFFPVAKKYHG